MKLYITGTSGAGKTTMARQLAQGLGLPHYQLDAIYYNDKTDRKRPPEEQLAAIEHINAAGGWLIEGIYRPVFHPVLALADEIIFLDPPLMLRYWRIAARYAKQRLGIEACSYNVNFALLRRMYHGTRAFEQNRPAFQALLEPYAHKLVHLHRPQDYPGYK